jgi:phosphoribosylformylglycinamidine cyclo-ligase
MDAEVDTASWTIPHLFLALESAGGVAREEMFRAFNMGVGMVVITDRASADAVTVSARDAGVRAWTLGRVTRGTGAVTLT